MTAATAHGCTAGALRPRGGGRETLMMAAVVSMESAMRDRQSLLSRAFVPGELYAVYQPVVRLDDLKVVAHEGLMRLRGPSCSPVELLDLARAQGRLGELESLAARVVAQGYDYASPDVHLMVNLSCKAILQHSVRPDDILHSLASSGADLGRFVIELTERDITEDAGRLAEAVGYLRAAGIRVALDDFGNGHSNFEMWHEVCPELVKIDRYLIDGIAHSAGKLSIVKALLAVAEATGADLIAEGIECEADLVVVRDLGIRYGQGYLLGRPLPQPAHGVALDLAALLTAKIQVLPQARRPTDNRRVNAAHLLVEAPVLNTDVTNEDVVRMFREQPELHALPVVDAALRPLGLINRRVFAEKYAQPYARELYGRRPCTTFMHATPLVCDIHQSLESMTSILRGEDQRYLSDGFVITEQGRYRGLGTGEALVRRVTEQRIEAARYANPLTFLPGNIPVTEHIGRLLESSRPFVVAYCDLNHFKPFNDQYGYFRGDRMILLVAQTVLRNVESSVDFAGHIGGDDFVVLFQSDDWERRCQSIVDMFNEAARDLFDGEDAARGGLESEDRQGRRMFFPLSTLCIGAAMIPAGTTALPEEVASLAATAKRQAKRRNVGVHIEALTPGSVGAPV